MGDRNLWTKLGLIVVLLGLSAWQIWPLDKTRLKPGIDLGGGHSLLFEVDDSGLDPSQKRDLAERVTTILRQRVDPQNSRNLVWRSIGWNRIEIQMPKTESAKRDTFDSAKNALVATSITEAQIRAAMVLPAERRQVEFDALAKGVASRKALFNKLAEAHDRYVQLSTAATSQPAEATSEPAATQPSHAVLAKDADQAFIDRRKAIEEILKTNLDIRVMMDVLELDKKSAVRADRLKAIRNQHPDLATQIDNLIVGYDEWAGQKGSLDDPSDLMRLLRGAGKLEFRILAERDRSNPSRTDCNNPAYREDINKYVEQLKKYGPRPREGDNFRWFEISKPEENSITQTGAYIVEPYLDVKYVLTHATPDMGLLNEGTNDWSLRGAYPGRDPQGRPAVNFELDARGGNRFSKLTRENLQRPLCIFLDNTAISAATIRSEISTNGQISGNFSVQEVQYLVNTLDAGVLPARLKETPLQQKSVGPSLGATNQARGVNAAILATLLVMAFMAIYYTFNGVIADIALLMNLVLTLGVMSFLQATFTLPGIAGMVLTLGMAVDANVLIYERMREELSRGVSARMAIKLGYEKAFSAILDSNVTTILTAVILGSLGSEEIKGFGLTLGIGLTTSLFTALFVTRRYYNFMTATDPGVEETRKTWIAIGVLLAAGALCMGLGYLLHADPKARAESGWWGLGSLLMVVFLTALVLLGSLYAFRAMYHATGYYKANRLPMLKLMATTNIDWMSKVKYLWSCSGVLIALGFILLFTIDKSQYLDIEFLGGTGVQVQIKPERSADFAEQGDEKIKDAVTKDPDNTPATAVGWLRHAAKQIAEANVAPSTEGADQYLITTRERYSQSQIEALLLPKLEEFVVRGGIRATENGYLVQFNPDKVKGIITDATSAQAKIREAAQYLEAAANLMRGARVQLVEEGSGDKVLKAYEIIVTETQKTLVAESIVAAMQDVLKVTQPIQATIPPKAKATDGVFPIEMGHNTLVQVIGEDLASGSTAPISDFKGGAAIVFDDLTPAVTPREMERRLRNMRLQPDFEDVGWRDAKVIPLVFEPAPPGTREEDLNCKRIAVVVADPAIPYIEGESNENWKTQVAAKELKLAQEALASSRALERVTQFAPQVAQEAVQKAIIAIVLSLIAIAIYVWVRFGAVDFGLAGIIALFHDVATTIAALMICHHIHDTWLGRLLMLQDFKFDLSIIAALLTIVGFSINDTIVIFDRIRENRGRLAVVSPSMINNAVNQTLSRTIITSFTVFLCVGSMYFVGGDGIHGFCFAMLFGVFTGTYSTVMIASPILYHPRLMWVSTILIGGATALLIASGVSVSWLKYALMALILAGAAFALVRQWAATSGPSTVARAGATT